MHRVELKAKPRWHIFSQVPSFLMHRVELKGFICPKPYKCPLKVPNAPCGVESKIILLRLGSGLLFLMHRVELKAGR
jgi:hypothetical protein